MNNYYKPIITIKHPEFPIIWKELETAIIQYQRDEKLKKLNGLYKQTKEKYRL